MDDREARRAVRTNGGGVGVAIAAASGSASGIGGATADSTTITGDSTAVTFDGATAEAMPAGATAQGTNGTPLRMDEAVSASPVELVRLESESEIFPPEITVDPPASARYRARDVMQASTWTGRRSAEEQVTVIRTFAPDAMAAAEQLRAAIHDKRRNDLADAAAMDALKNLHWAIGELIREAERGPISAMAWESYERHREKLTRLAQRGASFTAAAPLAVGLAHFLSWLSGVPVGETLVAGVYGTMIGGEALRAKRR